MINLHQQAIFKCPYLTGWLSADFRHVPKLGRSSGKLGQQNRMQGIQGLYPTLCCDRGGWESWQASDSTVWAVAQFLALVSCMGWLLGSNGRVQVVQKLCGEKKVFDTICLCLWSNMLSLANFVQKQSKTNLVMHMASFHQCPTAELIQDASQQDFSLNGLEK